jgi:hypothetical protein
MVGFRVASGFFKLLGRIFVPLGIALTVIDSVIGAFKGFKKDGLKGIIPGLIAGIVEGLTFGLIKFDTIFKYTKRITDVLLMGFKSLFAIFVFVFDSIKATFTLIKDILSGKGIVASFSKFFDNMGKAFGKLLYTLYDITIGAVLRLLGVSDKTIKKIYTTVVDAFMWWWKWTKAGIDAITDGVKFIFNAVKEHFMWWWKWTKAGIDAISDGVKWLWNTVTEAVMVWWKWTKMGAEAVADGAKWLYDKTIGAAGRWASDTWDATTGFFGSIGDGISGLWSKSTSWVSDKASKVWDSVTGFFGSMFSWLPDSINPFSGSGQKMVDDVVKGMSEEEVKVLKESLQPKNSLKQTQAEVHARHMEETSRKPLETVVTNTTVNNNSGGGGKAQPMTIIAPQPPRNAVPTIRSMQFGEQPAF